MKLSSIRKVIPRGKAELAMVAVIGLLALVILSLTFFPEQSLSLIRPRAPIPTEQSFQPSQWTPLAPRQTATPAPTPTAFAPQFVVGDSWVVDRLAGMTLEQKVGQVLMVGVDASQLSTQACELVKEIRPAGVLYLPGNLYSPDQLSQYSASLQGCAQSAQSLPLFLALDHGEEYFNRFYQGMTLFPAAIAQAATGDPQYAYRVARSAGNELVYSGINMVLAPVTDVLARFNSKVSSLSTFGGDPKTVGEFVSMAANGYRDARLVTVMRDFPGRTGLEQSNQSNAPVDFTERDSLNAIYLPPYRDGIASGVPVVMLSKTAFPALSGDTQPVNLSDSVIRLLRRDLQFDGIILSDVTDLRGSDGELVEAPQAAISSFKAGADLLLVSSPADARATYQRLLAAVKSGEIPETRLDQALGAILKVKAAYSLKSFELPAVPVPNWQANASLAAEVGDHAVTLFKDDRHLLPLSENGQRILVIGPSGDWSFYARLQSELYKAGMAPKLVYYQLPWFGQEPETIFLRNMPKLAVNYDVTLIFTWQAHLNNLYYKDYWQVRLVNNILRTGAKVIVVALQMPTDIIDFPRVSTYLATYGTNQWVMDALVGILVGEGQPLGQNPLPGLPLR